MSPAALEALLERCANKRVLCIGDLVLDRFVYGAADRVSREAPVVAMRERRRDVMLGACGNVARNIDALGGEAVLAGVIGDDAEGHELSTVLAQSQHIKDVELVVAIGRSTPVKTRYVSAGHQLLCVDRDPDRVIDADTEDKLIEAASGLLTSCDVVILSDYGRGSMTPRVSRAIIEAANAAGKKVAADPRGRDFSRYDGAFLIKPNTLELSLETGLASESDSEVDAALSALEATLSNVENLLATRGARGMALKKRGAQTCYFPSQPRDVFDVSGAGDTSISALALAVAAGASLPEAIAFGNRAAGVVVTKAGTATVRPQEIIDDALGRTGAGNRVVSLEEAVDRVARWRHDGLRVGLTNGCFDILHAGHLATLAAARAECDKLVVAVNSDASVKRLKGAERPINAQDERAELIAALAPVDLALIFSEDTAIAVTQALRPDVYVKGGDYQPDTLPEAPVMRELGVEIVITPFVADRSTTSTIAKLAGE